MKLSARNVLPATVKAVDRGRLRDRRRSAVYPQRPCTDDSLGGGFVVPGIPLMRLSGRRCQRRPSELRFD